MIEHGEKESKSTRDSEARVRDLSGGQGRQNRAVHSGQGRPAAQEDSRRRNLPQALARILAPAGGRRLSSARVRTTDGWGDEVPTAPSNAEISPLPLCAIHGLSRPCRPLRSPSPIATLIQADSTTPVVQLRCARPRVV